MRPEDFWMPINRAASQIGCNADQLAQFIYYGHVRGYETGGVWYLHIEEIPRLRAKAARELGTRLPEGFSQVVMRGPGGGELSPEEANAQIKRMLGGGAR